MDAAGFYFFLAPNQIAAGGINGLSLVINHYYPQLALGLLILICSLFLLVISFILIGLEFGFKSIYCSIAIPLMIWAMENIYPLSGPISTDIIIQLFWGILISSTGLAILFNQNASSGGTDIIARILQKYYHINMGKGLLAVDFLVTFSAGIAFGWDKGMYALLGVILYGFTIDYIIEGLNVSKHVTIITSNSEIVKTFIIEELKRGATIYAAKGAYTGQPRDVVVTIIKRREFIMLRNYLQEADPQSFVAVQNTHEVLGEGFSF